VTLASHSSTLPAGVIVFRPGEGRHYDCGPMHSVFLADGEETGDRYSVSLWWVASGMQGPGAHSHEANEELFYVVEGTMTFLVGDQQLDAEAGTFIRIPAGVTHDFENRTTEPAGVFNVFIPGGFESHMPEIIEWFKTH
jgi:mannose-6-phosphate isomerase-like protein (cupin superfamily)